MPHQHRNTEDVVHSERGLVVSPRQTFSRQYFKMLGQRRSLDFAYSQSGACHCLASIDIRTQLDILGYSATIERLLRGHPENTEQSFVYSISKSNSNSSKETRGDSEEAASPSVSELNSASNSDRDQLSTSPTSDAGNEQITPTNPLRDIDCYGPTVAEDDGAHLDFQSEEYQFQAETFPRAQSELSLYHFHGLKSSEEEFAEDPAHKFWSWDQARMQWFHQDENTGNIIWCPNELD
ncbi:hypothetical protein C8034_v005528 [Colletotrichum sidae]|uniref:Uncharacterized protein n=1 Tax=Colletotrichum sidae TaxID=1347389 RepID=A0A4R8T6G5_9PEZI|nr:hypothetical protein C8034_v005528 [Colletotrichum sidae]